MGGLCTVDVLELGVTRWQESEAVHATTDVGRGGGCGRCRRAWVALVRQPIVDVGAGGRGGSDIVRGKRLLAEMTIEALTVGDRRSGCVVDEADGSVDRTTQAVAACSNGGRGRDVRRRRGAGSAVVVGSAGQHDERPGSTDPGLAGDGSDADGFWEESTARWGFRKKQLALSL
ncbi:hypothetical protein ACLOJK_007229 [Asimina triloba]